MAVVLPIQYRLFELTADPPCAEWGIVGSKLTQAGRSPIHGVLRINRFPEFASLKIRPEPP